MGAAGAVVAGAQEVGSADPLLNRDVQIFTVADGNFVFAELGYPEGDTGMLRSRAPIIGPWERFRIVSAGEPGIYALWSYGASKYVSVEAGHPGDRNGELRARSTVIGPWEEFAISTHADGALSFYSFANNRWVSAELSYGGIYTGMLRARATALGAWERFRIDGPPKPTDNLNKPVYLIHGFAPPTSDPIRPEENCADTWRKMRDDFLYGPAPHVTGPVHTVGIYTGDTNCDRKLVDGTRDTSLVELGQLMAKKIYEDYSQHGRPVDVVAHSMGGLIIREALAGVAARKAGFPPVLYVEDVVTLGTPHRGTSKATACKHLFEQCRQMASDSPYLAGLAQNPWSRMGTDWTLMGSEDDTTAIPDSALGVLAQHKVRYLAPQPPGTPGVKHGDFRTLDTSGGHTFKLRWCGGATCGDLSTSAPPSGETRRRSTSPAWLCTTRPRADLASRAGSPFGAGPPSGIQASSDDFPSIASDAK